MDNTDYDILIFGARLFFELHRHRQEHSRGRDVAGSSLIGQQYERCF